MHLFSKARGPFSQPFMGCYTITVLMNIILFLTPSLVTPNKLPELMQMPH
jgi:hypothetical protein